MNRTKEQEEKIKAFENIVKTAQRLMVGSVYSKYDQSTVNYAEAKVEFDKAARDFLLTCEQGADDPDKTPFQ